MCSTSIRASRSTIQAHCGRTSRSTIRAHSHRTSQPTIRAHSHRTSQPTVRARSHQTCHPTIRAQSGQTSPPNRPGARGPTSPPANPNFVHGGASAPQGPAIIKLGPSHPVVNSTLLKPAPGAFQQSKPVFPAVHVHDKFWPIHKDSKFMWVRSQRRLFVPLALLGVVVIGGSYWYPDGYVSMEWPACTGFTPDRCHLQWRIVHFDARGG